MPNTIKKIFKKNWDKIILCLLILFYSGTFATLTVLRHNAFASNFDLSNMDHTMWNTLFGHFFSLRFEDNYVPRLSIHADFILILLSPLYLIWDDVRALLIAASIFIALGAIPTYLLAYKVLKNKVFALVVVCLYLLNPSMQWTNIYDFHGVSLAIPLLLAAFYTAYTKQWKWFAVFTFLALLTKEEISLFIYMLGLCILFVFKEKRIGIITLVVGLLWFVTMTFIVIPGFTQKGTHWGLEMYQSHIDTEKPSAAASTDFIKAFFTTEAATYYDSLLKPFGYLPIFGFPWLLLSFPELGINILGMPSMHTTTFHYDSGITPALVIATIFGIHYVLLFIRKIKPVKRYANGVGYLLCIGLLAIAVRTNYHYSPLPTTPSCWCFIYNVTEEEKAFEKALQSIPKDASITASLEVRPHVNHRKDVWFVPSATTSAQYIALITQYRIIGNYEPKIYENQLIPILLSSKDHTVRFQSEHFYLFERINK